MIVIFDVEGVLVDGEFLPNLAESMGLGDEVRELTLKGIRGEIQWEEGLKRRMELLKGACYEDCVWTANRLPLMKGARELCRQLRSMGCIIVGISGGFSLLARRVKEELALDHIFSNELVFHDGKLIGYGLLVNVNKRQILETALGSMIESMRKVAVVDGANDLELFSIADLKIGFNPQKIVAEKADVSIPEKNLLKVLEVIRKTFPEEARVSEPLATRTKLRE